VGISDEQMIAAAAAMSSHDFSVINVNRDGDGWMTVRFAVTAEAGTYGVRLPLPSSGALKPWLYDIPEDAADAAGMLTIFLDEEVSTGCVGWARTTTRDGVRIFEVAPYGFRRSDDAEHRRMLRHSGADSWWGQIQENDDPAQTPGGRKLAQIQLQRLTYDQVGATRADML
jgi:hypothetical protein